MGNQRSAAFAKDHCNKTPHSHLGCKTGKQKGKLREGFPWRKLCYECSTTTTEKHAVWFRLPSSQERELRGITQRAGYVSPAISGVQLTVLGSAQVSIWLKGPMAAE